jgi:hypothetical protein
MVKLGLLGILALGVNVANAQFGNIFEHLFQHQHQQQRQQQHHPQIPEDSNWLEQQYINSMCFFALCSAIF